ncbi:hypothetical protein SCLCIDRAFT_1220903 [Scleroderma citrinum Foug A]|uniref:Uncharacterized protein n=1 Tax=Scleroderma citrinum Foug A TaxID=1036808 RepID=A0A0C3D4M9_9AGAM|nr:hypothetical protein SCLCIDRAFT_1220903 [Scleroderma citrinum Foug A]
MQIPGLVSNALRRMWRTALRTCQLQPPQYFIVSTPSEPSETGPKDGTRSRQLFRDTEITSGQSHIRLSSFTALV